MIYIYGMTSHSIPIRYPTKSNFRWLNDMCSWVKSRCLMFQSLFWMVKFSL